MNSFTCTVFSENYISDENSIFSSLLVYVFGKGGNRHEMITSVKILKTAAINFHVKFKQNSCWYNKGFEPRSDSRSCSMIIWARVVLKRTVVSDSDRCFDNLSRCHHQSQVTLTMTSAQVVETSVTLTMTSLRLLKHQLLSPTTDLFRTTLTQVITLHDQFPLGYLAELSFTYLFL